MLEDGERCGPRTGLEGFVRLLEQREVVEGGERWVLRLWRCIFFSSRSAKMRPDLVESWLQVEYSQLMDATI